MNLFFDEVSQKLIINAKKEMYELKHPYVGSEHLFLSILNNTELEVTKMLNSYGITYENFRKELINSVGIGSKNNEWFLFTPLLKRIINNATYYSKDNQKTVTPYSLLISILQEGDGVANRILLGMSVDLNALYDRFLSSENIVSTEKKNKLLNELAINMNECSLSGKYEPVIGRDEQINQMIQILLRKNKNNPLLIGEAGVGKTAIVEELAKRISLGNVPLKLKNKIIYSVSMSALVAGTKYRGEFEERIHKLLREVMDNPNIILFIDEVHTLMGAGGAEGAIDASNIVKPYLARGELKIIGATTVSEYSKFLEKDKALDRRFQKVYIEEPDCEEVKSILLGLKPIYENYHDVTISDSLIDSLVDLSYQCVFTGRQPDKAIDLLDEVCSFSTIHNNKIDRVLYQYETKIKEVESRKNQEIIQHNFKKAMLYKDKEMKLRSEYNTKLFEETSSENRVEIRIEDLYSVAYRKNRIPDKKDFGKKLKVTKDWLKSEMVGQNQAIDQVISALHTYDYLTSKKAMTILLVGKSGVGKTFLVEKLIQKLFIKNNLIRLNMSEYRDKHSFTKIVGSFPGYVGYDDEFLFQSIKENPFSVILLDNVDKSSPFILNILLQAFDTGVLSNSKNETIYLSKCIVFMISSENLSSIGFIEKQKDLSSNFPKIQHVISFSEITRDDVLTYSLKKLQKMGYSDKKKNTLLTKIVEESNYEKNGLLKVSTLLEEMNHSKLKS